MLGMLYSKTVVSYVEPYRCCRIILSQCFSILSKFLSRLWQGIYCLITLPHVMCSVILGSIAFLARAKSQTTKQLLWIDRECPLLLLLRIASRSARAPAD